MFPIERAVGAVIDATITQIMLSSRLLCAKRPAYALSNDNRHGPETGNADNNSDPAGRSNDRRRFATFIMVERARSASIACSARKRRHISMCGPEGIGDGRNAIQALRCIHRKAGHANATVSLSPFQNLRSSDERYLHGDSIRELLDPLLGKPRQTMLLKYAREVIEAAVICAPRQGIEPQMVSVTATVSELAAAGSIERDWIRELSWVTREVNAYVNRVVTRRSIPVPRMMQVNDISEAVRLSQPESCLESGKSRYRGETGEVSADAIEAVSDNLGRRFRQCVHMGLTPELSRAAKRRRFE